MNSNNAQYSNSHAHQQNQQVYTNSKFERPRNANMGRRASCSGVEQMSQSAYYWQYASHKLEGAPRHRRRRTSNPGIDNPEMNETNWRTGESAPTSPACDNEMDTNSMSQSYSNKIEAAKRTRRRQRSNPGGESNEIKELAKDIYWRTSTSDSESAGSRIRGIVHGDNQYYEASERDSPSSPYEGMISYHSTPSIIDRNSILYLHEINEIS